MADLLDNQKRIRRSEVRRILRRSSAADNISPYVSEVYSPGEAMWVPPAHKNGRGHILLGLDARSPAALAHELGHEVSYHSPHVIPRVATRLASNPWYNVAGKSTALLAGALAKGHPFRGALYSGLLGAAAGIPRLIAERSANAEGKKLLTRHQLEAGGDKLFKSQNKSTLRGYAAGIASLAGIGGILAAIR